MEKFNSSDQHMQVVDEAKSSISELSSKFFTPLEDMSDSVFREKNLSGDAQFTTEQDSSLSLIDLETVDRTDIFTTSKIDSSGIFPSDDNATAILLNKPIEKHTEASLKLATRKSAVHNKETENHIAMPLKSPAGQEENMQWMQMSDSIVDNVSPLYPIVAIKASTPQNKESLSNFSDAGESGCDVSVRATLIVNRPHYLASGDAPMKINEVPQTNPDPVLDKTFSVANNQANQTFVKPNSELSLEMSGTGSVQSEQLSSNPTFNTSYSLEDTKSLPNDSGSLASFKEKKETKKTKERKPLSALNSESRAKPSPTSQSQKRGNRVQGPRMNAAAMSRIQARSPQNENRSSSLKPSSGLKSSRNQIIRKQVTSSDKKVQNLSVKLRQPVSSDSKKSIIARNIAATATTVRSSSVKRKLETVKEQGRTTKPDGNLRPNATSSSLIRNSATSRTLTSRATRLPKPQVTLNHRRSLTGPSIADDVTKRTNTARSRANMLKSRSATKNQNAVSNQTSIHKKSLCPIALATLLDYVVNRLDGLSAPQLSADKQHLQHLVSDQRTFNESLSSRVSSLEESLSQSREAHKRDVEGAVKCHEQEVTQMKANHERIEVDLQQRLDDLNAELTKKVTDYQLLIETLKEENKKAIEELTTQQSEELAQLRLDWSEERDEWERATLELQNSIDATVEAKVEELIQPYIDSYAENKSLRTVLEMKNTEQHKLQAEISQQSDRLKEVDVLREHVIRLQQRTEDLQTQVEDKNIEQRDMKKELDQSRRELNEQKRKNKNQQQRIDELEYKRDFSTPSPLSPFNPVFTPSPSTAHQPSANNSGSAMRTPVRGTGTSDSFATPRVNGSSSWE